MPNEDILSSNDLLELMRSTNFKELPTLFEALAPTLPRTIHNIHALSSILAEIRDKGLNDDDYNYDKIDAVMVRLIKLLVDNAGDEESHLIKILKDDNKKTEVSNIALMLESILLVKTKVELIQTYYSEFFEDAPQDFDDFQTLINAFIVDDDDILSVKQIEELFIDEKINEWIGNNITYLLFLLRRIKLSDVPTLLFFFDANNLKDMVQDFANVKAIIEVFMREETFPRMNMKDIKKLANTLCGLSHIVGSEIFENHFSNKENLCYLKEQINLPELTELSHLLNINFKINNSAPPPQIISTNNNLKRKFGFNHVADEFSTKRVKFSSNNFFDFVDKGVFIDKNEVGIDYAKLCSNFPTKDLTTFATEIDTHIRTTVVSQDRKVINLNFNNNSNRYGYASFLIPADLSEENTTALRNHFVTFFNNKVNQWINSSNQSNKETTLEDVQNISLNN